MIKFAVAALGAAISFSAAPAQAAYIITIEEIGGDVVATGSGSINTAGLTLVTQSSIDSVISPERGVIIAGENSRGGNSVNFFDARLRTQPYFGGGGLASASSSDGPIVGLVGVLNNVIVPNYYISGQSLGTSTSRYSNSSFCSLGLISGHYVFDLGRGADTFTINVGAAVPEPATWAMMMLGFGVVGYSMRRKTMLRFV